MATVRKGSQVTSGDFWQGGLLGYHMEQKRVDSERKGNEKVWGAQG